MPEQPSQPDKPTTLPVCPYCGADPVQVNVAALTLLDGDHAAFFCGNPDCRALFSIQLLGILKKPDRLVKDPAEELMVAHGAQIGTTP